MSEDRPARIDYGGRLFGTSDMNVAAPAIEGLPDEQHTSPVRRTFLLLIFFEFVLSWALWLVYVRTLGSFTEQIKDQVVNMRFNTSLFDVQIISTSRFFFLEVAYGAYMTSYRWPAAERMAKRIVNSYQRMNPDYLSAIEVQSAHFASIRQWATRAATSRGVGSIYQSPEGSLINDVESLLSVSKYNSGGTNDAPVDVAALLTRAEDLRRSAWDVFKDVAWNEVSSSSPVKSGYFITSANLYGFSQRVFRLDAILHARIKTIFNDLVHGIEFSPLWNSTVYSARCLQKFPHEDLDIVHLVTKEVLGGLIKSRDFVVLRAWGVKDDISYVASSSVTFPKCPPSDECVRAEQLINAMFLQPTGNVCHLVCITCCDLKGWFSSQVVARGIQVSLTSLYQALQKRAISLSAGVEDFDEPPVPRPSPLPPRQRPILDEAC